jgi:hypothetical protein
MLSKKPVPQDLTGRHPDGCGVAEVGETTSCGREVSDLPACIGSYPGGLVPCS